MKVNTSYFGSDRNPYLQTATTSTIGVWPIWTRTISTSHVTQVWTTWIETSTTGIIYADDVLTSSWQGSGFNQPSIAHQERQAYQRALNAQLRQGLDRMPAISMHQRQRDDRRRRLLQQRRENARKWAERRAHALLLSYLTPQQREMYERERHFHVCSKTGKTYRIYGDRGIMGNVYELDGQGRAVARLCAHSAPDIPVGDQLLTQMLWLRHHEAEFLRVANVHHVDRVR